MTALHRTPSRRQLLAIGGAGAATLSLGAPALALPAPDTPVWAAFRRWAAAHHSIAVPGLDDAEGSRRCDAAGRIEKELCQLQAVDSRDVACLAYVALHVADFHMEGDSAMLLGGDCNPATLAFVSGAMRAFPEVAAVITGEPF